MEDMGLRQWRLAKEITIEKMAGMLDVHPNTYANWEKEPEKIPIGKAHAISEIIGVSMESLFLPNNSTKC